MPQYGGHPVMDLVGAFPNRPLTPADIEAVRTHENIALFIEIDSPAEMTANGGTTSALALARTTLLAVTLEETGWTQKVLKRDASRHDLLHEAFDRILR